MFHEKHVPVASLVAATTWLVGGAVIIFGVITSREGVPAIGLWISGWGMVSTIVRCYEIHGASRERSAFELGCRVAQESSDNVRHL